jgi:hypothetical protein
MRCRPTFEMVRDLSNSDEGQCDEFFNFECLLKIEDRDASSCLPRRRGCRPRMTLRWEKQKAKSRKQK